MRIHISNSDASPLRSQSSDESSAARVRQLEKQLLECVRYLEKSDRWMDRHSSVTVNSRRLLGIRVGASA